MPRLRIIDRAQVIHTVEFRSDEGEPALPPARRDEQPIIWQLLGILETDSSTVDIKLDCPPAEQEVNTIARVFVAGRNEAVFYGLFATEKPLGKRRAVVG